MEGQEADKLTPAQHEGMGSFYGDCGSHASTEEKAPADRRPETTDRIKERRRYRGAGGDVRPVRSLRSMMQNRKESIANGSVAHVATAMAKDSGSEESDDLMVLKAKKAFHDIWNKPWAMNYSNCNPSPARQDSKDSRQSIINTTKTHQIHPDRFRGGGGGIVSRAESSLASSPSASHQFFSRPPSMFFRSVLLAWKHFNFALHFCS